MDWEDVTLIIVGIVAVLLVVGGLIGSYYVNNKLKYENFQVTVQELSNEQKCLHICGFQWKGYLENYKFCIEKCDRISERTLNVCS